MNRWKFRRNFAAHLKLFLKLVQTPVFLNEPPCLSFNAELETLKIAQNSNDETLVCLERCFESCLREGERKNFQN